MSKLKINKKENKIIIPINAKLYSLEAISGAAYVFIDKAYVFLDGNPEKEVLVQLKGKKDLTGKELKKLAGEFLNELLSSNLRHQISKNNSKIREYIVGAALIGALREDPQELTEPNEEKEWEKDPLGIAIPWEEKYKKRETIKKEKSCLSSKTKKEIKK